MADEPLDRYGYEDALRGPDGPDDALTQLVCLTVASFCKRKDGVQCWPSLDSLATISRLSRPTVIAHLKKAVAAGWLRRVRDQIGRMERVGYVYELAVPTGKAACPVSTPPTGKAACPVEGGRQVNLATPTGKADACFGVKQLAPKLEGNIEGSFTAQPEEVKAVENPEPENPKPEETRQQEEPDGAESRTVESTAPRARADRPRSAISLDLERWAAERGMVPGNGEGEAEFRRRISQAWLEDSASALARRTV